MRCINCNHTMKKHVVRKYRHVALGLPSLTVRDLVKFTCPSCGEGSVQFTRLGPLLRAIAEKLAAKPSCLVPVEVRYLRDYLGWSNEEFARRMGVTPWQASRWMKRPISRTAERVLRLYVSFRGDEVCGGDALRSTVQCFAKGISATPREARLDARLRGSNWCVEIA